MLLLFANMSQLPRIIHNMVLTWSQTPHLLPDIVEYVGFDSIGVHLQSQRHYWLLFKITTTAENLKSKTSNKIRNLSLCLNKIINLRSDILKNHKSKIWHAKQS